MPPQQIIAYGRSVGGSLAVDLASRQPVAGLILEGSLITAFLVVASFPIVAFDKFRNIDKLKHGALPSSSDAWKG